MAITPHQVRDIIRAVDYPRPIRVVSTPGERPYLQVQPSGRKWFLSEHMVPSEVVRTAFMACLAYEEHECRENFQFRGERVFSPHIDVEALVEASKHQDRRWGSPGSWEKEESGE